MWISVVLPTFQRPELLERCLHALSQQTLARESFEIIVADDANSVATRRQVESWSRPHTAIRYVRVTGRHGPAAARNAGWKVAQADVVAFTDDDCLPDSGWLAAGLKSFKDPAVIAVTGRTLVPLPSHPTDYQRNVAGLEKSQFITANCFCRRSALETVGGFDEQFTAAWREDSDLHFKLLDLEGKIVRNPQAVVIHPVRQAAWGISLREQRKSAYDALLYQKHAHRFREHIDPVWPKNYYAIVLSAGAALASFVAGNFWAAAVGASLWAMLTARFCFHRLQNTARTPQHIAEMVVTSFAIPFLSVFWRLYGAWQFRVLFW
jgi:GT2 family glycosyltransferase